MSPHDCAPLRKLLKDYSGLDLPADKQRLIEEQLLLLARRFGLSSISEFLQKLKPRIELQAVDAAEAKTIDETFFFRDRLQFDHFRETILPEIARARTGRKTVRIWSAAGAYRAAAIFDRHVLKRVRQQQQWCPGVSRFRVLGADHREKPVEPGCHRRYAVARSHGLGRYP